MNEQRDTDTFSKTYHNGITLIKNLKASNDLSFSDIGKLHMITGLLAKNNNMLIQNNKPMTIPEIADAIGDYKQNMYKTMDKLLDLRIITIETVDNHDVYCLDQHIAFNGIRIDNVLSPEQEMKRQHEYNQYLKSPEWKQKREQVLSRDNYQCINCGSKEDLNVHHLTYKHFKHELLIELITLCKRCHAIIHKKIS